MTRAAQRIDLHSSRLTRVLADMKLVKSSVGGAVFAEKLGQWLSLHDAINLRVVHTMSPVGAPVEIKPAAVQAVGEALDRVRASLTALIEQRALPQKTSGLLPRSSIKLAEPTSQPPSFETYRRGYLALQHDMERQIQALRAQARQVLATGCAAQKQLAALDAVLDEALAERESRLLAQVPAWLQTRFELLRASSAAPSMLAQASDQPDDASRALGWLASFENEFLLVLRAELDLRLQPVTGLMEALNKDMTNRHE